jgi:hypothetical protein
MNGVRFHTNVLVRPADAGTADRLADDFPPSGIAIWTGPQTAGGPLRPWGVEFFDPRATTLCGGTLQAYYAGQRGAEVHAPGLGQPPTGNEKHCILPGKYDIIVDDVPHTMEYVQAAMDPQQSNTELIVYNQSENPVRQGWVEATSLASLPAIGWIDLAFNIDLTPGAAADNPSLQAQSASPSSTIFLDQNPIPSGTPSTWYRFYPRSQCSGGCWNLATGRGVQLFRLFWDNGNNSVDRTGYYTAVDSSTLTQLFRIHQFSNVLTTRTVNVGVEVRQPHELENTSPSYSRPITIINTNAACFTWEGLTVWRWSDQEFNASCTTISGGGTLMFQWRTRPNGSWTPASWTTNPILDFTHQSILDNQFTVRAKRGTNGTVYTSNPQTVTILTDRLFVAGPSSVLSDVPYTYTASASSGSAASLWFDRRPPATGWTNIGGAVPSTTLQHAWTCGTYTSQLRADASSGGVLRRARMSVNVTHQNPC